MRCSGPGWRPVEELWSRLPDVSDADVARWKKARAEGNSFEDMVAMIERQGRGVNAEAKAEG